jgi:hypothetical protein
MAADFSSFHFIGRDLREAAKDAEIARLTHEVAQLRGSAAAAAS